MSDALPREDSVRDPASRAEPAAPARPATSIRALVVKLLERERDALIDAIRQAEHTRAPSP